MSDNHLCTIYCPITVIFYLQNYLAHASHFCALSDCRFDCFKLRWFERILIWNISAAEVIFLFCYSVTAFLSENSLWTQSNIPRINSSLITAIRRISRAFEIFPSSGSPCVVDDHCSSTQLLIFLCSLYCCVVRVFSKLPSSSQLVTPPAIKPSNLPIPERFSPCWTGLPVASFSSCLFQLSLEVSIVSKESVCFMKHLWVSWQA